MSEKEPITCEDCDKEPLFCWRKTESVLEGTATGVLTNRPVGRWYYWCPEHRPRSIFPEEEGEQAYDDGFRLEEPTPFPSLPTWPEYLAFTATTAIYPKEQAQQYLTLGLFGEVGELCDKRKKMIRDGEGPDSVKGLAMELGDVFWYLARLSEELKMSLFPYPFPSAGSERRELADTWLRSLAGLAGDAITCSHQLTLSEKVRRASICAAQLADDLGYSMEEVLAMNWEKLESRKRRNALQGSGDNR